MSEDQDDKPIHRRALAILVPLMFIALVAKAIVIGGSVSDMIIGVSVVALMYGTLISVDLYKKR